MPDVYETIRIAKSGGYSRSQLYAGMQALAEAQREPGQSSAQAFAKLVATPEGRELLALQMSLPGRDVESSAPATKSSSSNWEGLVRALMRLNKCTYSEAVNAALATDEGRALFRFQKRAEQIGTGQYSYADIAALDTANAEQDYHRDFHKRTDDEPEYEALLADVQRRYPHLTVSQAHDHVQSTAKGMAAWRKWPLFCRKASRVMTAHACRMFRLRPVALIPLAQRSGNQIIAALARRHRCARPKDRPTCPRSNGGTILLVSSGMTAISRTRRQLRL